MLGRLGAEAVHQGVGGLGIDEVEALGGADQPVGAALGPAGLVGRARGDGGVAGEQIFERARGLGRRGREALAQAADVALEGVAQDRLVGQQGARLVERVAGAVTFEDIVAFEGVEGFGLGGEEAVEGVALRLPFIELGLLRRILPAAKPRRQVAEIERTHGRLAGTAKRPGRVRAPAAQSSMKTKEGPTRSLYDLEASVDSAGQDRGTSPHPRASQSLHHR